MPYHDKTLIGLTVNIACGKSTVTRQLGELGADVIDADAIIHDMLRKDGLAYRPVVDEFGEGILGDGDEIDRRALGNIVFSDPARLRRLEEIEHPIVRRLIDDRIRSSLKPVVILDAIKLIESGWTARCDAVWVVTCEREQQIQRLVKTRHLSLPEAETRVNAQSPQELKVKEASLVIDNSGSLRETRRQVADAWQQLMGRIPATATSPD